VRDGVVRALRVAMKLGLRAAVAWGGALRRGCTRLKARSIEERASVHGTGGREDGACPRP